MEEDWDVYKENFIPLEQGRKVNELCKFMSINPNPEDLKKREDTRNEFEELLRCDNEDSLDVWYDYINWVEQNYPEGGEEANLKKLIENCISELFKIEKYHQNEKFFKIFLRYVRFVNDPLELFNLMFSSNIFTTIALFYINWAKVYEKNLKKAEEVIQLGINRFAQPRIQLDLAFKEIQTLLLDIDKNSSEEEEQDVRKPFIPLKVQKKKSGKALAPVERLANYDQKNYKLANQADLKSSNKQITIFNDENETEFSSINQQEKIKKLPTNNQENDRKAGKWCDNKVKSKIRIDQPVVPKFDIFDKDEEASTSFNADLRPKDTQTLKEKKLDRSPPLVVFEKLAPNQKFFCDLKKIYCGGTEFSFEEIRGIRLKIAKKKIEDKNTKEKLKKEVEELKNQISARDNLFNDVKQMKKKLELLIKQNSKAKINFSNEFNILDNENKPFEKKNEENFINDQVNKLDTPKNNLTNFDKNDEEKQKNLLKSPPTKIVKEDLTIVRDLWNGSIEEENTSSIEKELIQKPMPKDFSIFKDDEPENNRKYKQNKIDYKDEFLGDTKTNNFQDTNTFALPQGDFDFVAKLASTPSNLYSSKNNSIDENCTINIYQNRDKILSPIVETSKEYKSSSSSSFSSYSSIQKSRTFNK